MKFTLNATDWNLKADSFEQGHSIHLTVRGKVDSIEGDEIVIAPDHVGIDTNDDGDYPELAPPTEQQKGEDVSIRVSTSKEIKLPRAVNLAIWKKQD